MKLALSSCSRAMTAKKCTKKRDYKVVVFLPFSLPLPSSLLKLPFIAGFPKVREPRASVRGFLK